MGNPPICPICGESVADYKGPCPKPSPPTMAEQSKELVVREWGHPLDTENQIDWIQVEEGRRVSNSLALNEHNALARAYLALRADHAEEYDNANREHDHAEMLARKADVLQSELRAALAREAEARKGWDEAFKIAAHHQHRATAAEARCAEMVGALEQAKALIDLMPHSGRHWEKIMQFEAAYSAALKEPTT